MHSSSLQTRTSLKSLCPCDRRQQAGACGDIGHRKDVFDATRLDGGDDAGALKFARPGFHLTPAIRPPQRSMADNRNGRGRIGQSGIGKQELCVPLARRVDPLDQIVDDRAVANGTIEWARKMRSDRRTRSAAATTARRAADCHVRRIADIFDVAQRRCVPPGRLFSPAARRRRPRPRRPGRRPVSS